jgi:hypothetical protein
VIFNGHLWTAKWWSFADTPGGKLFYARALIVLPTLIMCYSQVPRATGPTMVHAPASLQPWPPRTVQPRPLLRRACLLPREDRSDRESNSRSYRYWHRADGLVIPVFIYRLMSMLVMHRCTIMLILYAFERRYVLTFRIKWGFS